jgi:hypothetical protein
MISPNVLRALRVIALNEADEKLFPAWYKSLCRWYSREFHTPLVQVEDMSEDYVIRTWYEDIFWRLNSGTKEQKEKFDEIVFEVLAEESQQVKSDVEQMQEEDDAWYEAELAAYDKQLKEQAAEKAKENADGVLDGILISDPNLRDQAVNKTVVVDDPIPDDEGL